MNVLPVIERELRVSARHGFTYYVRVLGALALLGAGVLFCINHGLDQNSGGRLFASLHLTLFIAIWLFVPFLPADSISRERREGTLGLLFLTPLRGLDIVLAKGLAHGLRALSLWLAVVPVLTIPFILGGVGWPEAVLSLAINLSAIVLALAGGLLASSFSRVWTRVLVYAGCFTAVLCLLFVLGHLFIALFAYRKVFAGSMTKILQISFQEVLGTAFGLAADWDGMWSGILTRARTMIFASWAMTGVCVIFFAAILMFAARRVTRVWREPPPSQGIVWLEKKFCTPVLFKQFYRRWTWWKLDRNPVGWLEQRTWTGRLVTWSWLGVITIIYCVVLADPGFLRNYGSEQEFMAWLMAASMAISAAGSFRRERETGVLELLLVSPLRENEIVTGRLRGLWAQFLPATGMLLAIWIYFSLLLNLSMGYNGRSEAGAILFYAGAFFSVPVIGLYFSLLCRNFISAFLATLGVSLVVPATLGMVIVRMCVFYTGDDDYASESILLPFTVAVFQLILAGIYWSALRRRLRLRTFPFARA